MAAIKLKPGETVIVAAVDPSLEIGGGPMPGGGDRPVDPGYGIDLGLGFLRPTHPIVLPPPGTPTHPIALPPEGPVDPGWGIDADIGYVHPDNTLPIPQPPTGGVKPGMNWEIKTAWTPVSGWIVVAVPTGAHATPSTGAQQQHPTPRR